VATWGDISIFFEKTWHIPKLYYKLDSDDKELLAEIRAGQRYTIDRYNELQ